MVLKPSFDNFKAIFVGMTHVKVDCLKVTKIIFLTKTSNYRVVGIICDPKLKILFHNFLKLTQNNLNISFLLNLAIL